MSALKANYNAEKDTVLELVSGGEERGETTVRREPVAVGI